MAFEAQNLIDTDRLILPDLAAVYDRTHQAVEKAILSGDTILLEAPPGTGKTTAIPKVVEANSIPVTYLTQRRDLYKQMADRCQDHRLSHQHIPAPHRDCPTFVGDYGDHQEREVKDLYNSGVPARRIHKEKDLPCQPDCPYLAKWEFDSGNYDVLIGNFQHAYVNRVIYDRVVILDEFPGDAFVTHFESPESVISSFLRETPTIHFTDTTGILNNRYTPLVPELLAYTDVSLDPTPELVLENPAQGTHALASVLTLALIGMRDLGNGFEATDRLVTYRRNKRWESSFDPWGALFEEPVVRNRDSGEMWVLSPPDLSAANGVIGLDGTPTPEMWNTAVGETFDHREVLEGSELNHYLANLQNYTIKLAGDGMKPYSSGNYVSLDNDASLFLGVAVNHADDPCLIAPQKALDEYQTEGYLDYVAETMNFANVESSNRFAGERVGIVSGSPHPGDTEIQKWGAFMGRTIESKGKGLSKSYGPVGDRIHRHFVHHRVLQAILRFGRDGNGATVYVNTKAVPDWLDIDMDQDVPRFKGAGTRAVVDHLLGRAENADGATVAGIVDKTDYSESHIRAVMDNLIDGGYIEKYDLAGRNGADLYVWTGEFVP